MCYFERHRVEDEYEFPAEPDGPDEEVGAEFEEAEDVRIVADGGDD